MRLLIVTVLLLFGCAQQDGPPGQAQPTATWSACPRPQSTGVPVDLPLINRETLNLGEGVVGSRLVYQRTAVRRVVLSVGDEPLDALEDLDMDAVDTSLGDRRVTVSRTRLQPGLAVLRLEVDVPERCGDAYVVAEGLTDDELSAVVSKLSLRSGP